MAGKIVRRGNAIVLHECEDDWSDRVTAKDREPAYSPDLRGIERDHVFLGRLRDADVAGLIVLAQSCVNGPTWRQVAVARALARMPRRGAKA